MTDSVAEYEALRQLIIDTVEVEERSATLEELYEADELFLASTVREVEPISALDDRSFDGPRPVSDQTREAVSARIRAELAA